MDNKAFSSIDWVGQCLVDNERTRAFEKAIKKAVKPGDTVLDAGTGSGVFALFAAQAGAARVVSIEYDPYIADVARRNFSVNGFTNIELRIADARNIRFQKTDKFDVVIMEMITTGMIDEAEIPALNNLYRQHAVDAETIFIPFKQETYITLMDFPSECYGLKIPMVKHLWRWHDWSDAPMVAMTEKVLLHSVEFHKPTEERVDTVVNARALKTGKINAIHLSGRSCLDSDTVLSDTESINAPVVIPIEEYNIHEGETVKVRIRYTFGSGYGNFSAEVVR